MPTRWCAWTALVVSVLMGMLLGLSFLIRYPDTVDGEVSITGAHAPIRLQANAHGRLHLLEKPNTRVRKNQTLAYIESGAEYEDVLTLVKALDHPETAMPENLKLGELAGSYHIYLLAAQYWERLMHSERYATMRKSLEAQISSNKDVMLQLAASMEVKAQARENLKREFERDSLLAQEKIVSASDLERTQNTYLAQREAEASLRSSHLSKLAEIRTSQLEIVRSRIEEEEQLEQAYMDMMAKRNVLQTELRLWEEKYVVKAPMEGMLDYLGFWRDNVVVQTGLELFTILPKENRITGEARIPAQGAGKVKVGQAVNIKLHDYPYDEFGLLVGEVVSISRLTNKTQINQGVIETYLVHIALPDSGRTNFGHQLPLNFESKGVAEIITQPKRLIERLFDNLKAKTTK